MKDGAIEFQFADGTYLFRLPIGQLRELQEKCTLLCPKTGQVIASGFPLAIYNRLQRGEWAVDDVVEVIRLALIGGDTTPVEARNLVERYVEPRLALYTTLAVVVLGTALSGGFESEAGGAAKKPAAAQPMEPQAGPLSG